MKPTKNLPSQQLERAKAQIERLQETVKVLTVKIKELEAENKKLLRWGVESEAVYRKESEENKLLRQQLFNRLDNSRRI